MEMLLNLQALPPVALAVLAVAIGGITLFLVREYVKDQSKKSSSSFPPPPEIPGLPVIGNLLELKEKKPYKTFTKWAQKYGPIYSIKTGANKMVVLNSNDVAKEALVTKYSSISTRKLSNALKILSHDKSMVAVSDYNEFHRTAKAHLLTSTLGTNAQKRHRIHRDDMINNICHQFHAHAKMYPTHPVNFREIFQSQLFRLSLKQAIGDDAESVYVEELGLILSRQEIYEILVVDPMQGAIEVDWRDFFPYLKWIPNKGFEHRIQQMHNRRQAVMKALIEKQKKRIASGKDINCYLDHLLSEANTFSEQQILMLLWEDIIESTDTTIVAAEWAMYELSKDPNTQNQLLSEIQNALGSDKLTEEKLCQLPYLAAVFQETLRMHSPVPIVPLRYVDEETQLGGYNIPQGTEIAINIYGCNMDPNVWDSQEDFKPERFLGGKDHETMELHKTVSFGGGKRICAGALQAMTISCIAIGRLVQEFEWRLGDGEEENVDTMGLTTHKLHPLLTIIKPRSQV